MQENNLEMLHIDYYFQLPTRLNFSSLILDNIYLKIHTVMTINSCLYLVYRDPRFLGSLDTRYKTAAKVTPFLGVNRFAYRSIHIPPWPFEQRFIQFPV